MIDKNRVVKAIEELILAIGEDPKRDGLKRTPIRVAELYAEIFSGNSDSLDNIKAFQEEKCNELIVINNIPLYSVCEHHLLPFFGKMHVAFVAKDNKILGLGQITRIVNSLAKKLQIQERLTDEVATIVYEKTESHGVLVIAEAEHLCMTMRGEKTAGTKVKTISAKGNMEEDKSKRLEAIYLMTGTKAED
ncbi:MAG: GTP cyclohydrolase I [Erysipelotrichales bacterium]|nr:GTP cyclohydrolase I [Erysipelotrichales bacterium]